MSFFKIALLTLLLMSFSKIGLADSHEEPLPLNDPFAGDDGTASSIVSDVTQEEELSKGLKLVDVNIKEAIFQKGESNFISLNFKNQIKETNEF